MTPFGGPQLPASRFCLCEFIVVVALVLFRRANPSSWLTGQTGAARRFGARWIATIRGIARDTASTCTTAAPVRIVVFARWK